MKKHIIFDYQEAFSRTLGWVTAPELQQLRHKRVAIAGAGGVGGVHLLTLARLGIGAFNISDLDTFELANFNRQAGAMMTTLGRPKVEVMAAMARDINPELKIRVFPDGIKAANVEDFLQDVDLYVDALDFFAFDARQAIFAACARLGIPAITVAPLGMGAALINFLPGQMTFEQYFGLEGQSDTDKGIRFLVGLAPKAPHRSYLVEPQRIDLVNRRGPSTPMAVQLCAGVAGSEALKILLKRGKILAAPHSITYDAFLNRRIHCWRPGGQDNPLTRLSVWLVSQVIRKQLAATKKNVAAEPPPQDTMSQVLNLARWAPTGDNEQPWQFEVRAPRQLWVHFHGSSEGDLYDYDGQPALISLGCLTENLRLAASSVSWAMRWKYLPQAVGGILQVDFEESPGTEKDMLCDFLDQRSVDRRPYRRLALTPRQKLALTESVGEEFSLCWLESSADRWQASRLNMATSQLRLGLPEAIRVHKRILDFDTDYSKEGIPAKALGASPMTLAMTRWVMASPKRAEFILGKLPGATLAAQLEMELIPGMACAGHFMLLSKTAWSIDDKDAIIRAGMALQRFWLTAARLGLVMQPSVAMLSFAYYGRKNLEFSKTASAMPRAQNIARRFARLCEQNQVSPDQVVFMGRIGTPSPHPIRSRSIRKSLVELLVEA